MSTIYFKCLLLNYQVEFHQTLQEWFLDGSLSKLFKDFNSMATKRKNLLVKKVRGWFERNNLAQIVLGWPSSYIDPLKNMAVYPIINQMWCIFGLNDN